MQQQCLFCCKNGIFNLYDYGSGKYTIRDDLIEVFGLRADPFLKVEDLLCDLCVNLMENVASLIRLLFPLIIRAGPCDKKPAHLGKMCGAFASINLEDESEAMMSCPSPSSSILLKCTHSKPYEAVIEHRIAMREAARSSSLRQQAASGRSSAYYFSDASTNGEVSELFQKKVRRRKKGKNRRWTHKKNKSRGASTAVTPARYSSKKYRISPTGSDASDCSYQSYYRPQSRDGNSVYSSRSRATTLTYRDGKLVNKRTRSVSRAQELQAQEYAERELSVFNCDKCDALYIELDEYTAHKITEHNMNAMYVCNIGCSNKYLTMNDLLLHKKVVHDSELLVCSMCGIEIQGTTALQEHMKEHFLYSVPCIYCDKYFLNKKCKDDHVKEYHKGKKKRVKQTFQGIIDRVDKSDSEDDDIDSEHFSTPVPFEKKDYVAKILPIARSRESSPESSLYPEVSNILSRYRRSALGEPIRSEDGRDSVTNADSVTNEDSSVRSEDGRYSVANECASVRSEDGRDSVTNEGMSVRSEDGRVSVTIDDPPPRSENFKNSSINEEAPSRPDDAADYSLNENNSLNESNIADNSLQEDTIDNTSQQDSSITEDVTDATAEESQTIEENADISSDKSTLGSVGILPDVVTSSTRGTFNYQSPSRFCDEIISSKEVSDGQRVGDNNSPLPTSSSVKTAPGRKRSISVSSFDSAKISFAKIPKIILVDCMKYKSVNPLNINK